MENHFRDLILFENSLQEPLQIVSSQNLCIVRLFNVTSSMNITLGVQFNQKIHYSKRLKAITIYKQSSHKTFAQLDFCCEFCKCLDCLPTIVALKPLEFSLSESSSLTKTSSTPRNSNVGNNRSLEQSLWFQFRFETQEYRHIQGVFFKNKVQGKFLYLCSGRRLQNLYLLALA